MINKFFKLQEGERILKEIKPIKRLRWFLCLGNVLYGYALSNPFILNK